VTLALLRPAAPLEHPHAARHPDHRGELTCGP
jgi:hypothetical protein